MVASFFCQIFLAEFGGCFARIFFKAGVEGGF
jgi:hypothetical protein